MTARVRLGALAITAIAATAAPAAATAADYGSRTMREDGYLWDFGPHRFHSANPAIMAEIKQALADGPR